MTRRDVIRWSRNQLACMAIGGVIGFVLELIGVVPPGQRVATLAMAALVTLFGAFAAGEYHELMCRAKD